MDLQTNVIIIDGVNKTYQVESIRLGSGKYAVRFKNSERTYFYSLGNVIWLTNPVSIDIRTCHVYVKGEKERNAKDVLMFGRSGCGYYAIVYGNGFVKQYPESEVDIHRSCLTGQVTNVFEYLKRCAGLNTLGVDEMDKTSEGILSSIYSKLKFIDETTAAAAYMNPKQGINHRSIGKPIFPFGCNASQERAVKAALSSEISVIQGPPGTGKTQTILNIIANLLIEKKTVLVVSNNNSATDNVLEKMAKNGFGFLVAPLGNRENKEAFIANQPPLNPELLTWRKSPIEMMGIRNNVKRDLEKLETLFQMQERLAVCRQELAEVEIEMSHFKQEYGSKFSNKEVKTSSSKILKLTAQIRAYAFRYRNNTTGLYNHVKRLFDKLGLELRLRFSFEIKDELTLESIPGIISLLEWLFYIRRIMELKSEIENIEHKLSQLDEKALLKSLTDSSMTILKGSVAARYKQECEEITSVNDLFRNSESVLNRYPIVLSTTFSSRTCFDEDTLFDFVIMDEASQVSVETGLLALTCAKNAVIVGDTMQLPNVVTEEDKKKLEEIRRISNIPDSYDVANHSFLSSVLATLPNVPETLLREHYRCHPDIINFCNQKFYGGNLLIMTKRSDNEKHLLALTTASGQHCRGHYNQREIDAVKIELLPLLDNFEETGIIAPYNSQVDQFIKQIPDIEAATVHKYQGREKDTIIMSVTDDMITEFADNANLLNVAVSRAKNKFCLVVTGNPQKLQGNINDLLNYIKYQQGIVIESKLHSIFDYLFSKIEEQRRENDRVSDFASENLTFELIESIRKKYPQYSHIKAICHYPFRYLINDFKVLSEREQKYASHPSTHIDFLIINRVSKLPILAIETDGYSFHNETTEQYQRDRMKDKILESIGLPIVRI